MEQQSQSTIQWKRIVKYRILIMNDDGGVFANVCDDEEYGSMSNQASSSSQTSLHQNRINFRIIRFIFVQLQRIFFVRRLGNIHNSGNLQNTAIPHKTWSLSAMQQTCVIIMIIITSNQQNGTFSLHDRLVHVFTFEKRNKWILQIQ